MNSNTNKTKYILIPILCIIILVVLLTTIFDSSQETETNTNETQESQQIQVQQTSQPQEDTTPTPLPTTQNATIRYIDGEYIPDTVHISLGGSVTWINESQVFWPASNLHPTHRAYPGSDISKCNTEEKESLFDACEAKGTNETYTFKFNEPGQWRFHDHINPQATGTVVVLE